MEINPTSFSNRMHASNGCLHPTDAGSLRHGVMPLHHCHVVRSQPSKAGFDDWMMSSSMPNLSRPLIYLIYLDMDVSENSGFSPQIIHLFIGFSIINHSFWGAPIFGNTHMDVLSPLFFCVVSLKYILDSRLPMYVSKGVRDF